MASALSQAKSLAKYNNKMEQANVKKQYEYNKKLAEQDRDWQEMMSNSAHQREIKDLKAAGLNPVLSVTGGSGASTPSGSSASVSKADTDMSLPGKVMDMAMAQLNSATALQVAAMNNANAIQVANIQGEYAVETKSTMSGDNPVGMAFNAPDIVKKIVNGIDKALWSSKRFATGMRKGAESAAIYYQKYHEIYNLYKEKESLGRLTKEDKKQMMKYKRYLDSMSGFKRFYKKKYRTY